jgi:hypothetical protein
MKSQSKSVENEAFWKKHYESLKASGVLRSVYCRQHNLNYDRFGYWINKWNNNHTDKLVAIKLKPQNSTSAHSILCTLDLKQGHTLKIYDMQTLMLILERYT